MYGASVASGVGSQTRVTPAGFRTSTRVVTSKTRQRSDGAPWAKAEGIAEGTANPAEARPVRRRNSRRCMVGTPIVDYSANRSRLAHREEVLAGTVMRD